MNVDGRTLVKVRGGWTDWHSALVPVDALQELHWCQPLGAPRPIMHAYLLCTDVVDGGIPHDCDRSAAPHRLLVCILRHDITPDVHTCLVRRVAVRGAAPSAVQEASSNDPPTMQACPPPRFALRRDLAEARHVFPASEGGKARATERFEET